MTSIYGRKDLQISATVGEDLRIELQANPTTGYRWRAVADETRVRVDEEPFQPDRGRIGAGGVQPFSVRSLKEGVTRVRFEYVQPWEGQPADTCEFEIDTTAG